MPKLDPYDRKLAYSYALGIFPSLQLLETHPEAVTRLLLHPDGLESEGISKLRTQCAERGIREEMAERVLKRESKKENCFAALVFDKYDCVLAPDADHIVLAQISDSGNLGTALRAALGFGYRDVAVIRPCVDVWAPHVLRASMGAFCRMRVRVFDTFEEYRQSAGVRALYPFMLDGAIPLNQAARERQRPFSLIFGNEASGLPPEYADMGQSVLIPQSAEIDSLNLSVAMAIAAYTFQNIDQ